MKVNKSRNQREGRYSGISNGKHVRWGSSKYGWKKFPLSGRVHLHIGSGIGTIDSFKFYKN